MTNANHIHHTRTRLRGITVWWSLASVLICAACDGDFSEFTDLEDFRLLAMRATPPELHEGEQTTLDALLFVEEGDLEDVRYRWSWCPVLDPVDPRRCYRDEAGFESDLGLERGDLDFDLGSDSTASFGYPPGASLLLSSLCENSALSAGDSSKLVNECDGSAEFHILLEVSYRGETIHGTKPVALLFDKDEPANQNPSFAEEVRFAMSGSSRADDLQDKEGFVLVRPDRPNAEILEADDSLVLGRHYRLFTSIEEESIEQTWDFGAQGFFQRDESLFVTWFTTTGATESDRTTRMAALDKGPEVTENTWFLPLSGDEDRAQAQFVCVLRDERGGVDWLQRTVSLRSEP